MLDSDYHHGNGLQAIFYRRKDVLTISIHGHPRFAYPYFSVFADERGEEEGAGSKHPIDRNQCKGFLLRTPVRTRPID